MASVILLISKPSRESSLFFRAIDSYITAQGFAITDNNPKTYFTDLHIPPNIVRGIIHTIKNTANYNKVIKDIYYSTNLMKG